MSMLLAIIQLFFIVGICLYEIKHKSISLFLWITLVIMFAIPHLLNCVFADQFYSTSVLNEASFFVILFCMVYIIFRITRKKVKVKVHSRHKINDTVEVNEKHENKIAVLFLLLLVFTVFYFVIKMIRISGALALINKFDVYKYNESKSLFNVFVSYLYNISSGVVLYLLVKKNYKLLILAFSMIFLQSMLSGSRLDMIVIFVAIICEVLIINSKKDYRKELIKVGIIGVIAIFFIYGLRTYRLMGCFEEFSSKYTLDIFLKTIMLDLKSGNGEMGLVKYFYYIIHNKNAFEGFEQGASYIRILLLPIPSSLLGGLKPSDFVHTFGSALVSDSKNFSVGATLFADCYGNFGFSGFLLGGFWAVIMNVFDSINNKSINVKNMSLMTIMGVSCITIGRGSVYNPLCYVFYSLLFFWFFKLLKIRRGKL